MKFITFENDLLKIEILFVMNIALSDVLISWLKA